MRAGHRAALPPPPTALPAGGGSYDPGAHTVAEVLDYAAGHPDQVPALIAAETAGKARSTLLSSLGAM